MKNRMARDCEVARIEFGVKVAACQYNQNNRAIEQSTWVQRVVSQCLYCIEKAEDVRPRYNAFPTPGSE